MTALDKLEGFLTVTFTKHVLNTVQDYPILTKHKASLSSYRHHIRKYSDGNLHPLPADKQLSCRPQTCVRERLWWPLCTVQEAVRAALLQTFKTYITLWGAQTPAADSMTQSGDLWAGAEPSVVHWVEACHCDWKSHPSQCTGHSLTTLHMPRDDCALFWYCRVSNEFDRLAFTE